MKYAIIGFGRSGKSVMELLINMNEEVFISDINVKENFKNYDSSKFEFGFHSEKILNSDCIIVSPGVPLNLPILQKAKIKGIPIINEIELACSLINNRIIAVTGTNGKTTTAYLIYEILRNAKIKSIVCGNMGIPVSSVVNNLIIDKNIIPIIEVSSFQLESINNFKPNIGILLNITKDHMDRYNNFEEYKNSKFKLFLNQETDDFAIINENLYKYLPEIKSKLIFFGINSTEISSIKLLNDVVYYHGEKIGELNLKWRNMAENYLAAIVVGKVLNIKDEIIFEGLKKYSGIPHRMQEVCEIDGVKFINNSMCTNETAFITTLENFDNKVILIAGGKKKNESIDSIKKMAEKINERSKYAVLMGESKEDIAKFLNIKYALTDDMDDAVKLAFNNAKIGDIIILSPGFASFDLFKDFSDRGEKFIESVNKLKNER